MTDDATHIVNPSDESLTLCGEARNHRITVDLTDPRPNSFDGCWTCLTEADRAIPQPAEPAGLVARSGASAVVDLGGDCSDGRQRISRRRDGVPVSSLVPDERTSQ
jgi:hypothetical protein